MHISTKIPVLKEAWTLLREINLDGLLTGDGLKVEPVKLMNDLLIEDKLVEFISIITEGSANANEMELKEVVDTIVNFTKGTADALHPLGAVVSG
jgi:hypothetical protein